MPRRTIEKNSTSWLWFILAIPLGLITTLWWQRKKLPELAWPSRLHLHRPQYTEPISIPIDTRLPLEEDLALRLVETAPDIEDDLQLIEGIGPKIAGLLKQHDITSFTVLAQTPIATLDEILSAARLRHLVNPETWAEQARLAGAGDLQGLRLLQTRLKGRRHTTEE